MSATGNEPMLAASGLECVRGERRLFADISFTLAAGTLLELRGANGSGKTSLLRMICGLLAPAAGQITWNGRPIRDLSEEYHAQVVYIAHLNAIKDELNPAENLAMAAQLAEMPHDDAGIAEALRGFGLAGAEHLPCKLLSQGQRRRAALARLKLSSARALWILDEPFAALDAEGVRYACDLLEGHLGRGGIAVLTTHQDLGV